jgi:hypothetical protein
MTAIATFLTVRQIKKQTEASYRPELAFLQTTVFAYPDIDGIPSIWLTSETRDSDTSPKIAEYLATSFEIRLYNIGFGTAKDVAYSWEFPVRDLVDDVNTNAQHALEPAYYKYENGMLSLESIKFRQSTIIWETERKQTVIGYVLPTELNREGVAVRIPMTFIDLVSSQIFFAWEAARKSKQKFIFDQIPPLSMELTYHDIAGGTYNMTFQLQLKIGMIRGSEPGKFERFSGYITAERSTPGISMIDWRTISREGLRLLRSVFTHASAVTLKPLARGSVIFRNSHLRFLLRPGVAKFKDTVEKPGDGAE